MAIVEIKSNAKLAAFLKAVAPGYRKRSVSLHKADSTSLYGGFWDGGSRNEYFGARIDETGERSERFGLSYPTSPPQFGGGQAPTVALTAGLIVLQGGTFCGKPSTLGLYASAETFARFGL